MALSIAKKLYIEVINDSNEVNLSLSNVQGSTFSERARMPLVLNSSDVFCLQKTRVQELTRMSILGQR